MHVLDGNVTALPVLSLVLDQISYVEYLVFLMTARGGGDTDRLFARRVVCCLNLCHFTNPGPHRNTLARLSILTAKIIRIHITKAQSLAKEMREEVRPA